MENSVIGPHCHMISNSTPRGTFKANKIRVKKKKSSASKLNTLFGVPNREATQVTIDRCNAEKKKKCMCAMEYYSTRKKKEWKPVLQLLE